MQRIDPFSGTRSPPAPFPESGTPASNPADGRLSGRFALIGRDPRCDIRLCHRDVSSRHALLIEWGPDLFCIDLGSRTGTRGLPGGKRYGWLTPETLLHVGPHRLRLQARNQAGAAPPPKRTILHQELLPPDSGDTACLEFLDEQIRPREYQLKRVLTLIGRRAPCRIQLRDSKISGVHCALFLADGELWVIDLLGRGGTFVDGQRVRAARLQPGQFLQVGPYRARVKSIGPERQPLAPSDTDLGRDMPTQEFITRLLDSRMITEEELSSVLEGDTEAGSETPRLQSALVKAGKLTPWAMRQLRRTPVPDLMLGKRYRLLEPLARGGMATVFRGFDTRLHRPVAVKVVRKRNRQGGPLARQRLQQEVLIFAQLDHPHIVRVCDVDARGRYAVFEFVDGESLLHRLRRTGPVSAADAALWMIHVASALEYAWERGVIHRDIKPSNIILTAQGSAKLLDFGLAQQRADTSATPIAAPPGAVNLNRRDRAVGTLTFMSPEQLRGEHDLDTRTDIYGVGCTLYMLLSGYPPFAPAPVREFVQRRLNDDVPAIDGVDPALMAIVQKTTAHDVADRFQTPADLRMALEGWLRRTE